MTTYAPHVVAIIVGLGIVFLLLNWLWDKIAAWLDQKMSCKVCWIWGVLNHP